MSKKKSTQHHLMAGTLRADRHLKNKLQFTPASGRVPSYLTGEARKEWRRVCPLLLEQGVLLETDTAILGAYCTNYAGYRECLDLIAQQGHVINVESSTRTGKTVKPARNPAVTLMHEYQRAMLQAAAKLGFSPYDRERIEGIEAPTDDGEQPLQPVYESAPVSASTSKKKAAQSTPRPSGMPHGDALGPFIEWPNDEVLDTFVDMTAEEFAEWREDYYGGLMVSPFGFDQERNAIAPHGMSIHGTPKLRPQDQ